MQEHGGASCRGRQAHVRPFRGEHTPGPCCRAVPLCALVLSLVLGLLLSLGEDGLGVEVGFENAPGGNIHGRYRRQQLPQLGGPPLAGERPGAPGLLVQ